MQHQDWDTVQWRKTLAVTAKEARERRLQTQGKKKVGCGGALRKLDVTEIGDIKKWGKKRGAALSAARTTKKMKQADLARAVNVRPADIANCERGTAKLDNGLLNKLRKVLGPFDLVQKG